MLMMMTPCMRGVVVVVVVVVVVRTAMTVLACIGIARQTGAQGAPRRAASDGLVNAAALLTRAAR